jgi:sensor histidine kinase regulating citrate/malate metabolism
MREASAGNGAPPGVVVVDISSDKSSSKYDRFVRGFAFVVVLVVVLLLANSLFNLSVAFDNLFSKVAMLSEL